MADAASRDMYRTDSRAAAPYRPASLDKPGDTIGPYKILEMLGEGGFGCVWAAEQAQPLKRRVALKLLNPGMDTKTVLARFEQERHALALMDQPNIARVLDAGATASGRPYFVMELVRGVPITQYCDGAKLSPRRRMELMQQVARAVQHAHTKGIIHREGHDPGTINGGVWWRAELFGGDSRRAVSGRCGSARVQWRAGS